MAVWFGFPFLLSLCAKLCYVWSAVIKPVDAKKPIKVSLIHCLGLLEAGSANNRRIYTFLHVIKLTSRSEAGKQRQNLGQAKLRSLI